MLWSPGVKIFSGSREDLFPFWVSPPIAHHLTLFSLAWLVMVTTEGVQGAWAQSNEVQEEEG